jgi:alpha-tubulin suppressor-like RCC1 family protein
MICKRSFFVAGIILVILSILSPAAPPVQGTYGGTTYEEFSSNGTFRTETISAGTIHTCAIQADGTPTCWGDIFNTYGQANADPGVYLQITSGDKHTCAIRENGTVNCWGDNTYGVLTPPDSEAIYQQVSAGSNFTCGILADGTLSCWGAEDGYGQVSNAPESTIFTQVDAGYQHACGLLPNGSMKCWGRNDKSQAPDSTAGPFLQVSSGVNHTCAIKSSDRSVQCWGDNTGGKATPSTTGPFIQVSAGAHHTCALAAQSTPLGGNLVCWGATPANPPEPAETFTQIAAGNSFNCGILTDGSAACWGREDEGQTALPSDITSLGTAQYNLSLGTACMITTSGSVKCVGPTDNAMILETPTTGIFTQISSTYLNTCGIKSDGSLICWGYLNTSEAGPFTQVSASLDHACALRPNGVVNCWGSDYRGKSTPPASTYFRQIAAGQDHFTCGIKIDNTLACWGGLSNGVIDPPPTGTYTQISAGWYHACAVETNGAIQCWGNSLNGTTVAPAGTFKQVSGGRYSNCAIRTDNTAICWGYSDGANNPPAALYRQISDDGVEACGIKTNGTLVCWGTNYSGEAPRLAITPATLPGGTVTVAYSQQLSASGGTAPRQFSYSGTLPPGLSLSSTGLLSGTPSTGGTYTFTVQARDSFYIPVEAVRTYTIYINRPPSATNQMVTTNEDTPKTISLPASDPDNDPLVWTISDPGHGTISGTPPNVTYTPDANWFGVDSFTFRVNDGTVDSRTATLSIMVNAVNDAPVPPVQPNVIWKTTQAYHLSIGPFTDVDSTTLTYMARLSSGAALPAWLSFHSATRTFSGTPAAADKGDYTLHVIASDGQKSGILTFTLTVYDEHLILMPLITR